MRVISGIAVSFDGKTSRYLPLPPLLPSRPATWQPCPARTVEKPHTNRGASSFGLGCGQGVGAGGDPVDWEALPGVALETIALFVSRRGRVLS